MKSERLDNSMESLLSEGVIRVAGSTYGESLAGVYPGVDSAVLCDVFERGMRVAKNMFLGQLEKFGITEYGREGLRGRGVDTVGKVYFDLVAGGDFWCDIASNAVPHKGSEIEIWDGTVYLVEKVCFVMNNSGTDASVRVFAKKIRDGKV